MRSYSSQSDIEERRLSQAYAEKGCVFSTEQEWRYIMMVMSHQEQTALCTVPSAEEGSEIYSLPFGRIYTEKKK